MLGVALLRRWDLCAVPVSLESSLPLSWGCRPPPPPPHPDRPLPLSARGRPSRPLRPGQVPGTLTIYPVYLSVP